MTAEAPIAVGICLLHVLGYEAVRARYDRENISSGNRLRRAGFIETGRQPLPDPQTGVLRECVHRAPADLSRTRPKEVILSVRSSMFSRTRYRP